MKIKLFIFLLVLSLAGFYGVLILISLMNAGTLVPHSGAALFGGLAAFRL